MLVDACVSEGTAHRCAFAGCLNRGPHGNDRDLPYQLDLHLAKVDFRDNKAMIPYARELLRLGVHLAGHRDADVVVREQFVHGHDISSQLGGPPLLFKRLDFAFVVVFLMWAAEADGQTTRTDCRKEKENGSNWGAARDRARNHNLSRMVERGGNESQNNFRGMELSG